LQSKNLGLEKENLILELNKKNKELTSTVLNLIERNKFISEISKSLEDINTKEDAVDLIKIKKVIKDIDRDMTKKLWQEFELRYVDVHKDFFEKLNKVSSGLTSNERRLSALLVLNMSTKDISSITYQSVLSIKTARYRLRKKLGLDKNENLILFLNSL
jgi:DNA-binding CsgD family transcriptional regulator